MPVNDLLTKRRDHRASMHQTFATHLERVASALHDGNSLEVQAAHDEMAHWMAGIPALAATELDAKLAMAMVVTLCPWHSPD